MPAHQQSCWHDHLTDELVHSPENGKPSGEFDNLLASLQVCLLAGDVADIGYVVFCVHFSVRIQFLVMLQIVGET